MSGRRTVAERARALVGVRFRPQGRSAEQGLDCIGVAVAATGADPSRVRRDYRLRSHDAAEAERECEASGLLRIEPAEALAGDVLIVRPHALALHVVVLTDGGFVHADMRLRRVVEVPGEVCWPVVSAWRHTEDEERRDGNPGADRRRDRDRRTDRRHGRSDRRAADRRADLQA